MAFYSYHTVAHESYASIRNVSKDNNYTNRPPAQALHRNEAIVEMDLERIVAVNRRICVEWSGCAMPNSYYGNVGKCLR